MNAIQKIEQPDTAAQMVSVIERMASNPSVDVDKLERLLAMQERIISKNAEAKFNEAMTSAQSEMGRVSADANNSQTRSKYASYAQLDRHLRPIYTKHGFSLSFGTADDPPPDHIGVLCDVSHQGGFGKRYRFNMPADGKGAKGGDVMTKTHAAGAAATYGMRYLLKMIFNVAIGEDDTDGNSPVEKISEKQVADIRALMQEVHANEEKFMAYLGRLKIRSIEEIPVKALKDIVTALESKRK